MNKVAQVLAVLEALTLIAVGVLDMAGNYQKIGADARMHNRTRHNT